MNHLQQPPVDECFPCNLKYEAIFRHLVLLQGEKYTFKTQNNRYLLFLLSGKIKINLNEYKNQLILREEMVFVSKNSDCQIELQEDCDLLLLRYSNSLIPNTHLLSESFYQLKSQITYECKGIPIKPEMKSFISQLLFYLNAGINSRYLHEIKQIELYLIFKYFYSKEEVVRLFYHSIGQEPEFTDAVLSNYKNSKTAKELAAKLGYGEKTFRKIFKYNFGTTPYRWMQQQIAREIQFKLFDKRIPLKEIMFDFGFTDSSHFNVYCKRNFGHPPSFIRNQMRNIPLQPIATKPKPIK